MATEASATIEGPAKRSFTDRMLDGIERVGNKVPHPVMIFVYLILLVWVLSAVLALFDVGITEQVLVPVEPDVTAEDVVNDIAGGSTELVATTAEDWDEKFEVQEVRVDIRSLLTVEGLRFIFTSFVDNFANFRVVATIFVVMIGVGAAENAGLMAALIRKLVAVAPGTILTFVIILVGGLSSVATDAGYLILIPLAGAAFLSVGRHPIAGIAAAYAGVSAAFSVNILITPLDAMLTEMTNEALAVVPGADPLTITANWYFAAVSTLLFALVMTVITARLIEPRLGPYQPEGVTARGAGTGTPSADAGAGAEAEPRPVSGGSDADGASDGAADINPAAEGRGLRYALFGLLGAIVVILLLTLPSGSPLRDPESGTVIGDTPFMDSLIFMISMIFLVAGIAYGIGAGTVRSSNDVIAGITKAFAGQGGLVFMLLVISQFIAYFNYSNMPRVLAGALAEFLQNAEVNEVVLLIGFILVIALIDIIMTGSLPKWAIFAPIFVPLFANLGVAPQTVLAAYRLGDSPLNVITPMMVYLPLIVFTAQRYQKSAGVGTIIALMIPYTLIILLVWIVFFVLWFLVGIPWGPGSPVDL